MSGLNPVETNERSCYKMKKPEENDMETQPKTEKGRQTQTAILETAVNIASVEGLEGLTIGRLAKELHMSKSGLLGFADVWG